MAARNVALKKISIKTVTGGITQAIRKAMAEDGTPTPLMRLIGRVVGTKTKTTDYGESTALVGLFRATDIATGQVYEGSVAWLPEVVSTPVAAALAPGQPGELAVEIGVKVSDSPIGYEYVASSLLAGGDSDPLAGILAKVDATAKALAAPKDDKAPAAPAKGKGNGK